MRLLGAHIRRGMTLIEIMIAVAILAVVVGMAWISFSTVTRQQEKMQNVNERLHEVEQAVNRMVRDLSTAFMTLHGLDESQTVQRYKTGFLGDEVRLDFTSMGYVRMFKDEKVGDQSEISYYLKVRENSEGRRVTYIMRREQAPINDDFTRGGTVLPLLEDVQRFRLSYWDDSKADVTTGSDGWVDEWDTEGTDNLNRLPSRVRIEIEIQDPIYEDQTMLISTQAQIHLTQALSF